MNRRGFLASILALGAAPAIVRADSLMRIVPRETEVLTFQGVPIEFESYPAVWNVDEIIAATIRARQAQIVKNVMGHNALFVQLQRGVTR